MDGGAIELSALPPEMQKAVLEGLQRHQEEQATRQEREVHAGLRVSALQVGIQHNMQHTDLVVLANRFQAAAEHALTACAEPAAAAGRRSPRRVATEARHECRSVRVLQVMPCLAFRELAVVVAEATVRTVVTTAAAPATSSRAVTPSKAAPGPTSSGGDAVATLEATWRSLHFANNVASPEVTFDAAKDPDPAAVALATEAHGPLTVQSMQLRDVRVTDASPAVAAALQRAFPPLAWPAPTAGFHAGHLDMYTRPLVHFALAELIMHTNGRRAVVDAARSLLDAGALPKSAAAVSACARYMADKGAAAASEPELRLPDGPYVVLGMGAGCVAAHLAAALPVGFSRVRVATLEIEPTVIAANKLMLGYPIKPDGMVCAVADAVAALEDDEAWRAAVGGTGDGEDNGAALIVLDCYDPFAQDMLASQRLLSGCRARLAKGGVLCVNAHINAHEDLSVLRPFAAVFGAANVHAGLVERYQQALVVCVNGDVDGDVPESTLRGRWDYLTVCRVASHPAVPLRVRSASGEARDVARGPQPALDAAGSSLDTALQWSWLDATCVDSSALARVPQPAGSTTSSDCRVRTWGMPSA